MVGWDRGADRASNDADVSSIPPIIPYGGFSPVRLEDGVSDGAFPTRRSVQACSRHTLTTYWFASVLRASRRIHECPAQCRVGYAPMHRRGGCVILLPRGPRSSPGCAVPVCHHLIDPIRPTRRHITTSPQGGLYECLRCAGAPRRPASGSGLSLTIPAWHAALYDPGEFDHRYGPVLRCRHSLRRVLSGSALPKFPQSASRGARLSGLPDSLTLRPARLLAPL